MNTNNCQNCNDQTDMTAENKQCCNCNMNCFIAIANIPMQEWNGTYSVEEGFKRGTIFPELDLPFLGKEAK